VAGRGKAFSPTRDLYRYRQAFLDEQVIMLAFLHTSPTHIETFDRLLQRHPFHFQVRHYVEEGILQRAKETGTITPDMEEDVEKAVSTVFNEGATVLLCTCSTIGSLAEWCGEASGQRVLRVDRPMARKAVAEGSMIAVVATLASTLAPTKELLREEAAKLEKPVELVEVVVESAWIHYEVGDREGYWKEIADAVKEVTGRVDVVVLAQASMMGVERYCEGVVVPIYSSPEIGLAEAIHQHSLHL
jgi:hypothetical protein